MSDKPSRDRLHENLTSPGWEMGANDKDAPARGTLEEVLRASHGRKRGGRPPGLIRHIETELELDAIQIATLWRQLGLPD